MARWRTDEPETCAGTMPRKKKPKSFSAVKAVKEMARERIGAVPRPQVLGNQKKKKTQQQRKPTLDQLLGEE
ncbi:MAG: hypothetical protein ABSE92_15625 [Terriglobales bacterium]|jgi:hypothetical protein